MKKVIKGIGLGCVVLYLSPALLFLKLTGVLDEPTGRSDKEARAIASVVAITGYICLTIILLGCYIASVI